MDNRRFDRLTVALAADPSRRGLLRLISGGGLVALFGRTVSDEATAKKKGNRKKKKCQGNKKQCGKRCIPKTSCCTSSECPQGEVCRNGRCANCTAADDCPTPPVCEEAVCEDGRCETALLPPGSPCPSDQFCIVGTTCNGDGECQGGSPRSCDDGIDCTTDPNHCGECGRRCLNEAPPSCGDTGTCAGGICQKWTQTICRPAACTGLSTLRQAGKCDGNGACPPSQTQDCAPYRCNSQTSSCLTACGDDADCIASHFCDGDVCRPRKENGEQCTAPPQCTSNFCVAGVCCNTACDGSGQTCPGGVCQG